MKTIKKQLIAIGVNSKGKTIEFKVSDITGKLYCSDKDLVSLTIPEGVKSVYCNYNQLTKLVLPKGVKEVYCYYNQLTELILPEGVIEVYCYSNNLTKLILPEGVKWVSCSDNQLPRISNCGDSQRNIYPFKTTGGNKVIKIGCGLFSKEKAIKAISNKYYSEDAIEYIKKVEEAFKLI